MITKSFKDAIIYYEQSGQKSMILYMIVENIKNNHTERAEWVFDYLNFPEHLSLKEKLSLVMLEV